MRKQKQSLFAIDCEALGGNWPLAAVQEGFKIQRRVALPGGFGNEVIEANRNLLGQFPVQTGPQEEWTPEQVSFLFGTPPCSGFSNLNTSKFRSTGRGIDSDIHLCTWDLIKYAARCTGSDGHRGPEIVSFESVQAAYSIGKVLMHKYLDHLNHVVSGNFDKLFKPPYKLTHVLMSGASVGAASERRRYFWVAHRVPFGVGLPELPGGVMTVRRRIQDLEERPLGDWPHVAPEGDKLDLIIRCVDRAGWEPGMTLRDACFRLLEQGKLPAAAMDKWFDGNGCWVNFAGSKVIKPDEPGPVITGGARSDHLHYNQARFLTVLELARLMGLPDTWTLPGRSINKAIALIGKNCPVESARWLSHWAKESLFSRPGPIQADEDGVIDVTHAWKRGKYAVRG